MDTVVLFLEVVRVAKNEMVNYEFSAIINLGQQFVIWMHGFAWIAMRLFLI